MIYYCYGIVAMVMYCALKITTTRLTSIEHMCEALEPKIKGIFNRLYRNPLCRQDDKHLFLNETIEL